jgi:hypothetical protein
MRVLLFVPILVGSALIVGGVISENYVMVGVGFGLGTVASGILVVLKVRGWAADEAERKRIWTSGRPATARVVAISDAPGGSEENPEVDLQLEVRAEGAPPSAIKVRSYISRLAIPRIQPGCEIQVRLDSVDGTKVVIDPGLTPHGLK